MELGSIRCARHGLLLASLFAAHAGPAMPRQAIAVQKMCVQISLEGNHFKKDTVVYSIPKNRDGDDDEEDDTNIIKYSMIYRYDHDCCGGHDDDSPGGVGGSGGGGGGRGGDRGGGGGGGGGEGRGTGGGGVALELVTNTQK